MTDRKRISIRAALPLLALTLLFAGPAAALDRGTLSLEVLVDGVPLEEYAARGKTYVEALEGREYSLRLKNRTDRRLAVALSVDGLNTIDAKVSEAAEASKWILDPYQTVTIDGWQTSPTKARRFFFTTEDRSYGAWLGETRNLGLISAVAYREKRRAPAPIQRPERKRNEKSSGKAERLDAGARSAPAAEAAPSDDYAATGIGRKMNHPVRRVEFDGESRPTVRLDVRYEYRDALVRLGVLPQPWCDGPLARRESSRGFEDFEFAPEPD